ARARGHKDRIHRSAAVEGHQVANDVFMRSQGCLHRGPGRDQPAQYSRAISSEDVFAECPLVDVMPLGDRLGCRTRAHRSLWPPSGIPDARLFRRRALLQTLTAATPSTTSGMIAPSRSPRPRASNAPEAILPRMARKTAIGTKRERP